MTSKLRHLIVGLFAAAGLAATSSSLHAQTTYYGTTNFYGGYGVQINDADLSYNRGTTAGAFLTSISRYDDGHDASVVETYCVDLFHSSNGPNGGTNQPNQAMNLVNGMTFPDGKSFNDALTPSDYQKAGLGRAAWLVDHFQSLATTGVEKAALQIAIWKAEYETNSSYLDDLNNGAIKLTGLDQAVADQAKYYLDQSLHGGHVFSSADGILVHYLHGAQDQLYGVPEPASLAMSATALVALCGLSLRRSRKSKAVQA